VWLLGICLEQGANDLHMVQLMPLPPHRLLFNKIYTVSQKNVPPLTCYNLGTHGSIVTIFGTNVAEKVCNQNLLYYPTSPN